MIEIQTPDELGAVVDEDGNMVSGEIVENSNPDPIDNAAWDKWLALCLRAEKVEVSAPNVDREKTTKSDLRAGYKELEAFVKDAELQAQPA